MTAWRARVCGRQAGPEGRPARVGIVPVDHGEEQEHRLARQGAQRRQRAALPRLKGSVHAADSSGQWGGMVTSKHSTWPCIVKTCTHVADVALMHVCMGQHLFEIIRVCKYAQPAG